MTASITGHLIDLVGTHGVYAVLAIMAVDALLPAGGEIVMLYAGAVASGALGRHVVLLGTTLHHGAEAYVVLALAGTLGYVLGSLVGWGVGARGGHALIERRGRWLHLGPDRMRRAERWFDRFGRRAVFLGRLTPLARSFVSIPAGVLGSPLGPYTVLTLAASLLWCFGFAGLGWALGGSYDDAHHVLRYGDDAVVLATVGVVVVVVRRALRRR